MNTNRHVVDQARLEIFDIAAGTLKPSDACFILDERALGMRMVICVLCQTHNGTKRHDSFMERHSTECQLFEPHKPLFTDLKMKYGKKAKEANGAVGS